MQKKDTIIFRNRKYYPVNLNEKIIYNFPYELKRNCDNFLKRTVSVRGQRLNEKQDFYKSFLILKE